MSTTEQDIVAKGLVAPRVTPDMVEEQIVGQHFFTGEDGCYGAAAAFSHASKKPLSFGGVRALACLTFCVLVLKNGFTVTGESACASPENFDADIGKKLARADAVKKIWPLMGYELKTLLSDGGSIDPTGNNWHEPEPAAAPIKRTSDPTLGLNPGGDQ